MSDDKKKKGIIDKALKVGDAIDYGSIALGAVTGGAGLVAGGALGVALSQTIKGLRKKKDK